MTWPETDNVAQEVGLSLVAFDQGALQHPHQKPTMALTDIPEIIALDGLKAPPNSGKGWPAELRNRLEASKEAAQWAPGLVGTLCTAIKRKDGQHRWGPTTAQVREDPAAWRETLRGQRLGRAGAQMLHHQLNIWDPLTHIQRQRAEAQEAAQRMVETQGQIMADQDRNQRAVRAVSAKEAEEMLDWKRHIEMGHLPYRRDCMTCVQSQGRDRPRKKVPTPESFTLSVDTAGPFAPGTFQEQGSFRYFMVGTYTVPTKEGLPLAEGLASCCQLPSSERGEIPNPERGEIGVPIANSEKEAACQSDRCCAEFSEWAEDTPDPMKEKEQSEEPLDEVEIQRADADNQRWKEAIKGLQDFDVKHLTFVIPMKTRHASEVIKVLAVMHARLSAMNLPLVRLHSDRAKEYVSKQLQEWTRARDIWHTTSAGDEAQGNSRAEAEINIIKGRVRNVMASSKAPGHFWPLAAYHCGEERLRSQLHSFGIKLPKIIPFGTCAMARTKRWHKRIEEDPGWSRPMQRIQVWGPAWQMSASSKGYYVEAAGHFLRTTVVVQCSEPPEELQPRVPE